MSDTITKLADQFTPIFTTINEIAVDEPELYEKIKYAHVLLQEALSELEQLEQSGKEEEVIMA